MVCRPVALEDRPGRSRAEPQASGVDYDEGRRAWTDWVGSRP